jgi:transposase
MQQPQGIDDSPAEQAVARVAAVDVAKASGVVCTRVPRETGGDGAGPGRFSTKVWTVSATTNAILELADHLTSMAIEMVVLETGHRLLAAVHLRTRSGRAACRAGRRCRARPAQTART